MTATHRVIGTGVARSDGPDKVTGLGKYSLDVTIPGTLWAKVLRSPYPHARVVKVDASRALELPGVQAVLTPDEVAGLRTGKRLLDEPVLAWDKVLFIGDKVAAVAAEDEDIAEQALALIDVEYEPLPAYTDAESAMSVGATPLHDAWPDNPDLPGVGAAPGALHGIEVGDIDLVGRVLAVRVGLHADEAAEAMHQIEHHVDFMLRQQSFQGPHADAVVSRVPARLALLMRARVPQLPHVVRDPRLQLAALQPERLDVRLQNTRQPQVT